jgi:zinc protease
MHEKPQEAGFAHLIEHLVFRQSRYLPQAAAIPTWQRLGATFGSDTNAETTPTATTYKIDLPDASPATLDESLKLISGMVFAPNLSESDIRIEAPIVLAEKRERGGTSERLMIAMRKLMAEGSLWPRTSRLAMSTRSPARAKTRCAPFTSVGIVPNG